MPLMKYEDVKELNTLQDLEPSMADPYAPPTRYQILSRAADEAVLQGYAAAHYDVLNNRLDSITINPPTMVTPNIVLKNEPMHEKWYIDLNYRSARMEISGEEAEKICEELADTFSKEGTVSFDAAKAIVFKNCDDIVEDLWGQFEEINFSDKYTCADRKEWLEEKLPEMNAKEQIKTAREIEDLTVRIENYEKSPAPYALWNAAQELRRPEIEK